MRFAANLTMLFNEAPFLDRFERAARAGFQSAVPVHGERMIKRTFNPGFRINLHQKDLGLALARARSAWRCRKRQGPRN